MTKLFKKNPDVDLDFFYERMWDDYLEMTSLN